MWKSLQPKSDFPVAKARAVEIPTKVLPIFGGPPYKRVPPFGSTDGSIQQGSCGTSFEIRSEIFEEDTRVLPYRPVDAEGVCPPEIVFV
jgi:hypothetical protein